MCSRMAWATRSTATYAGVGDLVSFDDGSDVGGSGMRTRQNLIGAGHQRREQVPVGVEHRHHEQHAITLADRVTVGRQAAKVWRYSDLWRYPTPFGDPVVPEV